MFSPSETGSIYRLLLSLKYSLFPKLTALLTLNETPVANTDGVIPI